MKRNISNSYNQKLINLTAKSLGINDSLKMFIEKNYKKSIYKNFLSNPKNFSSDLKKVNDVLGEIEKNSSDIAKDLTILILGLIVLFALNSEKYEILLLLFLSFHFYILTHSLCSSFFLFKEKILVLPEYKNVATLFFKKIIELKNAESAWQSFSWQEFEYAVTCRLKELGFNAENTQLVNDGGVDVVVRENNEKILIQCKKYNEKVGVPKVRDLIGAMKIEKSRKAFIVTTGPGYSKPAIELAMENNVYLFDLSEFLSLTKQGFLNIIKQ
jgi:HJR/Mrr/RecB family endonuclease